MHVDILIATYLTDIIDSSRDPVWHKAHFRERKRPRLGGMSPPGMNRTIKVYLNNNNV